MISSKTARRGQFKRALFRFPFYLYLFTLYPFLHLWEVNFSKALPPKTLFPPLLLTWTVLTLLFVLLSLMYRDLRKGALASAVMGLFFFSFGHFHDCFLAPFMVHPRLSAAAGFLIFASIPVGFFFLKQDEWEKKLRFLEFFFNILGTLMLLVPGLLIGGKFLLGHYVMPPLSASDPLPQPRRMPAVLPDIYYIIPDEYGRSDILQELFGFDNSEFIGFLKKEGFFVAEQSQSNYWLTLFSLSSSLNLRYLKEDDTFETLTNMIQYPVVVRFLKSLGYRYHFVNSGVAFNWNAPLADKTISHLGKGEFQLLLINTTLLRAYSAFFLSESWRIKHLDDFRTLERSIPEGSPKFVFAHFLLPHSPFVFDKDGSLYGGVTLLFNPKPRLKRSVARYKVAYPLQLEYANSLYKRLLKNILASSKTPPIILFQSDHGVDPLTEDWNQERELHIRMSNVTAVYAPPSVLRRLYPEITPVNLFRIVFQELFGTDTPPVEDKVFASVDENWVDVTEKSRKYQKMNMKVKPWKV